MRKLLWLSILVMALNSACVTVPITTNCSVAGVMAAGAICSDTTGKTSELTLDEFLNFLEPIEPSGSDHGHGAAICQSLEDHNKVKTALEQACRMLGKRCNYEARQAISKMGVFK